eukprot:s4915_g1.t1
MAPKTLQLRPTPPSIDQPRPGHGFGQATFAPDFTTFGFWGTLQLMLELLFSGRQPEQLWRPGSPFPGNIPAAMATLFPGTGPVNQSWTPPELYMVARSRLFWMFQIHPGSTLPGSPEAWAPFVMYLTLPLATLQAAVAAAQGTGYFRVQHADIPGTLDRHVPHAWAERQLARGCFQPITLQMLLKQGASDYTWLPPLVNHSSAEPDCPYGGFAYLGRGLPCLPACSHSFSFRCLDQALQISTCMTRC